MSSVFLQVQCAIAVVVTVGASPPARQSRSPASSSNPALVPDGNLIPAVDWPNADDDADGDQREHRRLL
jgi:hypothetical protein